MPASTSKKVVIYRFDREAVAGFVNPQAWLAAAGVELLTPAGAVSVIPYEEIKVVCFVKDFDGTSWKQERRLFASRPKTEGVWLRAIFQDNDFIEGVAPNDLLLLDPQGFQIAPPDASSNNQRLFLPRAALKECRVMGIIGTPGRTRKAKPAPSDDQPRLFE